MIIPAGIIILMTTRGFRVASIFLNAIEIVQLSTQTNIAESPISLNDINIIVTYVWGIIVIDTALETVTIL